MEITTYIFVATTDAEIPDQENVRESCVNCLDMIALFVITIFYLSKAGSFHRNYVRLILVFKHTLVWASAAYHCM